MVIRHFDIAVDMFNLTYGWRDTLPTITAECADDRLADLLNAARHLPVIADSYMSERIGHHVQGDNMTVI